MLSSSGHLFLPACWAEGGPEVKPTAQYYITPTLRYTQIKMVFRQYNFKPRRGMAPLMAKSWHLYETVTSTQAVNAIWQSSFKYKHIVNGNMFVCHAQYIGSIKGLMLPVLRDWIKTHSERILRKCLWSIKSMLFFFYWSLSVFATQMWAQAWRDIP